MEEECGCGNSDIIRTTEGIFVCRNCGLEVSGRDFASDYIPDVYKETIVDVPAARYTKVKKITGEYLRGPNEQAVTDLYFKVWRKHYYPRYGLKMTLAACSVYILSKIGWTIIEVAQLFKVTKKQLFHEVQALQPYVGWNPARPQIKEIIRKICEEFNLPPNGVYAYLEEIDANEYHIARCLAAALIYYFVREHKLISYECKESSIADAALITNVSLRNYLRKLEKNFELLKGS